MEKKHLLLIALVAIAGGSIPPFAKLALRDFGPFTLVFFRFLAASLVIYLFLPKHELSLRTLVRLKWVAIVGALNPVFIFLALQHLPANIIGLFYAVIPGLGVWYLWTTQKIKGTFEQLAGFVLGLAGVALISQQTATGKAGDTPWLGLIFVTIAVLGFFAYGLMSKEQQRVQKISGAALAFYFAVVTTIVSLPLAVYETATHPWFGHIELTPVLAVLYLGFIGTGIQYLLYQRALKVMEVAHANIFIYLQPVFGIILAALVVGEHITLLLLLGGAITLVGARLALSKPREIPIPPIDS